MTTDNNQLNPADIKVGDVVEVETSRGSVFVAVTRLGTFEATPVWRNSNVIPHDFYPVDQNAKSDRPLAMAWT